MLVRTGTFPTASFALRLRHTVHGRRARRTSAVRVPKAFTSGRHAARGGARVPHAHSPRRSFSWPASSSPATPVVGISAVPPVLHGGSAAPPASPPRGPVSRVRTSPPASPFREAARTNRALSPHRGQSPANQPPDCPGRLPVGAGFSLSIVLAPSPNPSMQRTRFARR